MLSFAIFSSNIIQDLKEECLDTPTEITDGSRAQQLLTRAQKEKEEYEEAYLTRLPVTKAEKHRQRKLTTLGTMKFKPLRLNCMLVQLQLARDNFDY